MMKKRKRLISVILVMTLLYVSACSRQAGTPPGTLSPSAAIVPSVTPAGNTSTATQAAAVTKNTPGISLTETAPVVLTTPPAVTRLSPGITGTPPVTVPSTSRSPALTPANTPGVIPGPATGVPYTPPVTNINTDNVGNIQQINFRNSQYVVFAWNDLGMHCANPTYDSAVLLPPYNTLWAQVIKRGSTPQIMTQGISVEYSFSNNTYTYGKGRFGQFWDNVKEVFGIKLNKNQGLNLSDPSHNNGLTGKMVVSDDHFEVVGVPLSPIDDSNTWNPYQVAIITVKDSSNKIIAQTRTMAPVSDEINCAKCHGGDAFRDVLQKHDRLNRTDLQNQKPVLCAGCHGDPVLGNPQGGPHGYLSDKIHGFHGKLADPPACYDCHPGKVTECSRSLAHTAADGNCTQCHGTLKDVSVTIEKGRIPWTSEPRCVTCHGGIAEVDTGTTLYRNATGHGGIYCAACHTSPHAMAPSSQPADNYQALQYQGKALPIGDCGVCHRSSRGGGELEEYLQTHGGTNPEHVNMCYICHTAVNSAETTAWPHHFQWQRRQVPGGPGSDDN